MRVNTTLRTDPLSFTYGVRWITSMMFLGSRSARRWLVIVLACLFGFARVAFASAPCSVAASGCLPAAVGVVAHAHQHAHGEACTIQPMSFHAASGATSTADASDAVAPAFAGGLAVAPPPRFVRWSRIAIAPASTSRLAVSARLRL
jgi:hypothetical protein